MRLSYLSDIVDVPQETPPDVEVTEELIHPDYDELDESLVSARSGPFDHDYDDDAAADGDGVFAFNIGKGLQ